MLHSNPFTNSRISTQNISKRRWKNTLRYHPIGKTGKYETGCIFAYAHADYNMYNVYLPCKSTTLRTIGVVQRLPLRLNHVINPRLPPLVLQADSGQLEANRATRKESTLEDPDLNWYILKWSFVHWCDSDIWRSPKNMDVKVAQRQLQLLQLDHLWGINVAPPMRWKRKKWKQICLALSMYGHLMNHLIQ